ncbi:MAG TPA: helix-turn-helix transcriptional regulator [Pseudonocardiaceae bacterium]|nr:helix-turn-helix transcriptional regulator [Pseudonocardiaceae bacterium]
MPVYVRARDPSALRARLAATGTTQATLARAAHTSAARISQIVSGRVTTITVTSAAAIELALGVPRGHLFAVSEPTDLVQPYIDPAEGAA